MTEDWAMLQAIGLSLQERQAASDQNRLLNGLFNILHNRGMPRQSGLKEVLMKEKVEVKRKER